MDISAALEVQGWFAPDEGKRLAELAAGVAADTEIVEIGAFAGRSTAFLVAGSIAGNCAHITSLDDWGPGALPGGTEQQPADEIFWAYQEALTHTGGWEFVTPLRARSYEVARYWFKPVGLLFLDATHIYQDTLDDIADWERWVIPGGIAAFHDYHPDHPGVIQALDETIAAGGWEAVDLVRSLRVLRRL